MSMRDEIIDRTFAPVEVGKESQQLIANYRNNKEVVDSDYDLHPLYALLKIMAYAKRCAYVIGRKNVNSYGCGDNIRNNYVLLRAYMNDFGIAYDEFVKHFESSEELFDKLRSIKDKLASSIAVGYEDVVYLMIDIFDTNSMLYGIEGIEYAR